MLPAALFCGGEKALKAKSAGALGGNAQGGDGGAGAGNGADRNACGGALAYQVLARVGDGGASGIGYQGAGFAPENPVQNLFTLEGLVVFIIAHQGLFQLQVVEKL